ncbi:cytochrome oxidase putative small subunit CydP [Kaarinaea lacus]
MEHQRPRIIDNLRKEILITLAIKTLFLYLLWLLFFQSPDEQHPANEQIQQTLFGISSSTALDPNSTVLQPKETLHGN